ncbi:MAG: hypothetical protein HYT63_01730 [Candidatus Yanofskybacteria bacterium]|nr:hypothetical protein [Candidatus Yanofskybacteria bacterium]
MSQILDLRKKNVENSETALPSKISGRIPAHYQFVNKSLLTAIVSVLALVGLLYLLISQNTVTAIFFFLIATVMVILGMQEKKDVAWEINQRGLVLDGKAYLYRHLKSFWIEYDPPFLKELSFKHKGWHRSYIKLPLVGQESPTEIRNMLLGLLPEERHEDTLIEVITRKLGM